MKRKNNNTGAPTQWQAADKFSLSIPSSGFSNDGHQGDALTKRLHGSDVFAGGESRK